MFKDPIYETREWVEDITNEDDVNEAFDEFSMAAQKIEEYILDNINGVDGWGQLSAKDRIILIYHRGTDWILAAAPLKDDKIKINKIINGECPTDFLRGYPFTFLSSEDEWRRMEKKVKVIWSLQRNKYKLLLQMRQIILYLFLVVREVANLLFCNIYLQKLF